MALEPGSNRSFGLIAAIYLFKCVKERKKTGCFNDLRLSRGILMWGSGGGALKSLSSFQKSLQTLAEAAKAFLPSQDNGCV